MVSGSGGTPRLTQVRQLVAERFARHGCPEVREIQETLLIRDGAFRGRRFVCGGAEAIWFAEESEVKFFDGARRLLDVALLKECPAARAA